LPAEAELAALSSLTSKQVAPERTRQSLCTARDTGGPNAVSDPYLLRIKLKLSNMEKPQQSVVRLEDIDFKYQNEAENHSQAAQRNLEEEVKSEEPMQGEML